jgi:hypothetical protein
MMELRIGLVAVIGGALLTAAGCGSSDEGTGDDEPRAGTGSSSAGTSAGGNTGGSAPAAGGSAGSPGTGGTGTTAQCVDGEPPLCTDTTSIRLCIDGSYVQPTCDEICTDVFHLATGPCNTTDNACECGDPQNVECFDGSGAFCACLPDATGLQCAEVDFFSIYALCAENDPEVSMYALCYQKFVSQDAATGDYVVDCAAAVPECGVPMVEMMPAMP